MWTDHLHADNLELNKVFLQFERLKEKGKTNKKEVRNDDDDDDDDNDNGKRGNMINHKTIWSAVN